MRSFTESITVALARVLDILFGLVLAVLFIRFLLELLAANPFAGFTEFIDAVTAPLMRPFLGIFPNILITGVGVIDISIVCAIVVYGIVGFALARIIALPAAG